MIQNNISFMVIYINVPYGAMVSTAAFQASDPGSIPARDNILW